MPRKALWHVTAFVAGAVVMGLEMVAFRLYAPHFGYSVHVWASLIAIVLLALSAGYALGGAIADRVTTDRALYRTLLAAAAFQACVVALYGTLLPRLALLGDVTGASLATLLMLSPPMALLATAAPFLVHLSARERGAGRAAGAVYAFSTLGSVAGVLVTTFVLLPRFGTHATLITLCGASALLASIGLASRSRRTALLAIPIGLVVLTPKPARDAWTVWEKESTYNLVRVLRRGGYTGLVFNRADWIQTMRDDQGGWTYQVFDDYALGPLLVPVRRALVLGMGGGGGISALWRSAPQVSVDAVEIDPVVIEAAHRFFSLRRDDRRLQVHAADARRWMRQCSASYDLIQVDIHRGEPYPPFHVTTVEFFAAARKCLSDGGLLMMNVIDTGKGHELLRAVSATLSRVFPSCLVLSKKSGNHMLFAFARPTTAEEARERLAEAQGSAAIRELCAAAIPSLVDLQPSPGERILTDDHAPVEFLVRSFQGAQFK